MATTSAARVPRLRGSRSGTLSVRALAGPGIGGDDGPVRRARGGKGATRIARERAHAASCAKARRISPRRSGSPRSAAGATCRRRASSSGRRSASGCSGSTRGSGPPTFAQVLELIHRGRPAARARPHARRVAITARTATPNSGSCARTGRRCGCTRSRRRSPTRPARSSCMRGTLRDITRQKQAEADRDRAMERLNIALFGSNLVLVDVDPEGVVYLSRALERTARRRAAGDVHDVRGADGAHARRRA